MITLRQGVGAVREVCHIGGNNEVEEVVVGKVTVFQGKFSDLTDSHSSCRDR